MTGKTKCVIGLVNNEFVHLPMKAVVSQRNHVDPEGNLWRDTLDATHQPILMVNNPMGTFFNEGITETQ
jgi:6-phosphofructokinase 1